MPIVGGLDIHRKQITFDYLDTVTGEVRRGQIAPADRAHLRAWLAPVRRLRRPGPAPSLTRPHPFAEPAATRRQEAKQARPKPGPTATQPSIERLRVTGRYR